MSAYPVSSSSRRGGEDHADHLAAPVDHRATRRAPAHLGPQRVDLTGDVGVAVDVGAPGPQHVTHPGGPDRQPLVTGEPGHGGLGSGVERGPLLRRPGRRARSPPAPRRRGAGRRPPPAPSLAPVPRTLTVTRSAPATTWAFVATRPRATTQPLPTCACPHPSDPERTCTTDVQRAHDVRVRRHGAVGRVDRFDRLGTQALEHPREDAVVHGLGRSCTRPSAADGMSSVEGRHHRRVRDQLARRARAAGAHRARHDPHDEHGGDEHGEQAEPGVDRLHAGSVTTSRTRRASRSIRPCPSRATATTAATRASTPTGVAGKMPAWSSSIEGASCSASQAPPTKPTRPEHCRHEALPPAAPGVQAEQAQQGQVEGRRPAHPVLPRIHGDITRSGSGRSTVVSHGTASPARSNRLLSSIAVNPHTNRSPTSNAGPL